MSHFGKHVHGSKCRAATYLYPMSRICKKHHFSNKNADSAIFQLTDFHIYINNVRHLVHEDIMDMSAFNSLVDTNRVRTTLNLESAATSALSCIYCQTKQ